MMIVLRRSNKIGSRVIRFFTSEPASHIGVSFDGKTVYHSDSKGCRAESLEDFCKGSETLVRHYAVPMAAMRMRANEKLGTKYDFLGVVGFGLLLLLKLCGFKAKIPLINPRWMMCSEYAEYILMGTKNTLTPIEVVKVYEGSLR